MFGFALLPPQASFYTLGNYCTLLVYTAAHSCLVTRYGLCNIIEIVGKGKLSLVKGYSCDLTKDLVFLKAVPSYQIFSFNSPFVKNSLL